MQSFWTNALSSRFIGNAHSYDMPTFTCKENIHKSFMYRNYVCKIYFTKTKTFFWHVYVTLNLLVVYLCINVCARVCCSTHLLLCVVNFIFALLLTLQNMKRRIAIKCAKTLSYYQHWKNQPKYGIYLFTQEN